ncbi:methyltransferase domain-containing protein [Candidatus Chlorohelix sp.]|uniref:class I SAM-dependent methyltransferase n=1 Tax=Candidatus Chlorohelix sp. TaxID=3139201 RepID=UPI00306C0C86
MIDSELLELVRCPHCIEKALAQGKTDDRETGQLTLRHGRIQCRDCSTEYTAHNDKPPSTDGIGWANAAIAPDDFDFLPKHGYYLDLMPRNSFEQNTRYLEEEFEHEIDHEYISLPWLGAAVRNDLLRKMLKPSEADIALEVGCGNGKFCYWNRDRFGTVVGLDAAPLFAEQALDDLPLIRGDVRLLPFAPESFNKIFSIDLLEHLPADGIAPYFAELNRVLKPGGQVFIFSNTREMGKLTPVIKLEKKVANYFARKGIFDFKRDELRKSDHIKAIRTFDELEASIKEGGFKLERTIFWNGVFQSLVDNVIVKAGEYLLRRRVKRRLEQRTKAAENSNSSPATRLVAGTTGISPDWADGGKPRIPEDKFMQDKSQVELEAEKVASDTEQNAAIDLAIRKSLKRSMDKRTSNTYMLLLRILTFMMRLDIWLFGKMRTGPYFILIRKVGTPRSR